MKSHDGSNTPNGPPGRPRGRVAAAMAGLCLGLLCPALAAAGPPSPTAPDSQVSVYDILTSGSASGNSATAIPAGTQPPDADRSLSAEGARVLLSDAVHYLDAGKTAEARAILADLVARRSIDDPSAQQAALLMARSVDSANAALPYLQLLQLSNSKSQAGEACDTALAWAERAETRATAGKEPPALRLIGLAEKFALQSKDPAHLQAAILARAVFYVRTDHPDRARDTLIAAERKGLAGKAGAAWLALRGDTALVTFHPDEALQAYERLSQGFPSAPQTLRRQGRLGLLLELKGRYQEARRCYTQFRAGEPAKEDAHWVQARLRAVDHPFFPPPETR